MADGKDGDGLYEGMIGWGIMLVVFGVLAWLFWYYFDTEIRNAVRWVRYAQMWVVSLFIELGSMIGLGDGEYQVYLNGKYYSWRDGFNATSKFSANEMQYQHMAYIGALAMQPLKIPLAIIMLLGALWAIFKGPKTQYRTVMSLESLIERQSKVFPVIAPFIDFNPSKQKPRPPGSPVPAELPSFAEALGPEEWLAYNNVLAPDGKIDEESAEKAFIKQLGGRWRGVKHLPDYQQILLASFCLKSVRKRNEADDMLGRIALCWSHKNGLKLSKERGLLREARKILADKNIAGKTLAQCNRHAFVNTALLGALHYARSEGGVLAPAQFVWLRAHDRTLWYPLNNLGRQSLHMEAVGAHSHYKTERLTKRPIPVPKVERAVKTITDYMASTLARPIPQLDYSGSKKRGIKKAV